MHMRDWNSGVGSSDHRARRRGRAAGTARPANAPSVRAYGPETPDRPSDNRIRSPFRTARSAPSMCRTKRGGHKKSASITILAGQQGERPADEDEHGRASWRERVSQYVKITVGD